MTLERRDNITRKSRRVWKPQQNSPTENLQMNHRRVGQTLLALAALSLSQPPGAHLPANERAQALRPSIATITEAWARRQAALNTIRITWHTERTAAGFYAMIKSFNSPKPAKQRSQRSPEKASQNPMDLIVTLRSQSVLCLADDRLAYTSDTEGVDKICGPAPKFRIPSHVQMILSGGNLRKYSDSRTSANVADAQTASITSRSARRCFEMGLPEIKPLALALRPVTSTVAASDLAKYKISTVRGRIGADAYLILEPIADERSGKVGPRTSYWLDPAQDYAIVRAVVECKGRCQRQIDITYDSKSGGGLAPMTWSVILLNQNGGLDQQFRSIRDTVLVGGSLPPSTFEIDRADSLLAKSRQTAAEQRDSPQRDIARTGSEKRPGPSFIVVANAALAVLVTGGYLAQKYKGMLVKR
jgi:hypothetical protein